MSGGNSPPNHEVVDMSASVEIPRKSHNHPEHQNGVPMSHGKAKSGRMEDFLDLADSSSRLGTSPDITSRLEQKRIEHERQRIQHQKEFEDQMRRLKEQQEQEEKDLMARNTAKKLANGAVSAPVSPPRSDNASTASSTASKNAAQTTTKKAADFNAAKSMPGSRRNSDAAKDALAAEMDRLRIIPGGSKGRASLPASAAGGDQHMTSFLFDDELDADLHNGAYGGRYLQMNTDDDKFPILVRRDDYPGILSAASAALDLAPLSQTPPRHGFRDAVRGSEWPQFPAQGNHPATNGNLAPKNGMGGVGLRETISERPSPRTARTLPAPRSPTVEMNVQTNVSNAAKNAATSPEAKRSAGINGNGTNGYSKSEMAALTTAAFLEKSPYNQDAGSPSAFGNELSALAAGSPFSRYSGLDTLANGGSNYSYNDSGYGGAFGSKSNGMFSVKSKRETEPNRFAGLRLEDLQGDMAALCKDQHGCRFLQKKLEEGNPEHRDMIFNEIYPQFGELMTDSFGNYLSQKLLEFSTDEQRDALLESISSDLVTISLNMHGTRAVQKMIDYLSTQRQVQSLIMALNLNVVTLIKDLNGNHVIQKCLNTLPPEDNQFIYNAVAANCIEVATHRHGCCVLQRCIDHASESQRIQLVTEITYNSLTLVLDPFGNYVVQYVLDLNDPRFISAIVNQFRNNVCALSAQKFSSNVVEKCVRVADLEGRKLLISELIDRNRLERMLRDSFANYVVQTALDYAEPSQRAELVAIIRPVLPMIRNTPYGKRIQSKIQRDNFHDNHFSRSGGFHPALMNGLGAHYFPPGASPHFAGMPQAYPGEGFGRVASPYGAHPFHQAHLQPAHVNPAAMQGFAPPPFPPSGALAMEYSQSGYSYH